MKRIYISPQSEIVEMKGLQMLCLSKDEGGRLRQNLTNCQVLDNSVQYGNLSKDEDVDDTMLW